MYGQKGFKIQGLWECYTSLSDTVNPDGVQLWQYFDNSKVSTMLMPSFGLPPEKAGIVSTDKYKFKNDTLTVYGKENKDVTVVKVINKNLIRIRSVEEKKKQFFILDGQRKNKPRTRNHVVPVWRQHSYNSGLATIFCGLTLKPAFCKPEI